MIIATSSTEDPSRLQVDLSGSLRLNGEWRLALLEITLSNRICLFEPEKDYIHVRWTNNNNNRNKRTTHIHNIHPVKLSNFFPWINQYMLAKHLSEEEVMENLFLPSFSTREMARMIDIPQNLAYNLYLGAIQFCENINTLRKEKTSLDIWPAHVNTDQLKKLGFIPRSTVDYLSLAGFGQSLGTCSWLNILHDKTGEPHEVLWMKIYNALFQNKILEYLQLLQFSTWEFVLVLDVILSDLHSHLYDLRSHNLGKVSEGEQIIAPTIDIAETATLQTFPPVNIYPIKIKNYFPWIYRYQKNQNLNDKEMMNIIFSPSFPFHTVAGELNIEYSKMTVLHTIAVLFCLKLKEIIQGVQTNIWPEDIPISLLGKMGFKARENMNNEHLSTFEREINDISWLKSLAVTTRLDVFKVWKAIHQAVFNNRLEQKSRELGISSWELMEKMETTLDKYHAFLDKQSQSPKLNEKMAGFAGSKEMEESIVKEEVEWPIYYSQILGGISIQLQQDVGGRNLAGRVIRSVGEHETRETLREIIKKIEDPLLEIHSSSLQIQSQKRWLSKGRKLHFGELRDKMLTPTLICDFFKNNGFKTRAYFNKLTQKIAIHVAERETVTLHGRIPSVCSLSGELVGPGIYVSQYCLDPFIDYRTLYVYCDSTSDIILGEQILPVIQFLAPDNTSVTHVTYTEPCHIPLNTNHLTKINLVIYNETGKSLTFETSTPSTAKLLLTQI